MRRFLRTSPEISVSLLAHGLLTKATAFWGKLGEEGQEESGEGRRDKGLPAPIKREDGIQGTVSSLAEAGAAGVVSTVMVKPESRMEEIPEEKGRRALGFVNHGVNERTNLVVLNRTQMPALLIEAAFINNDSFKRKKQIKTSIPEEKADFTVDNNSFLLDGAGSPLSLRSSPDPSCPSSPSFPQKAVAFVSSPCKPLASNSFREKLFFCCVDVCMAICIS